MKISINCVDLVKEFEGCKLTAYKCPAGVWTIGYGHTKGVHEGQKITMIQAEKYLWEDLIECSNAVDKYNLPWMTQSRFDALVSFTFNCGTYNLKLLLDNGKRSPETVSAKMLLYTKANGKALAGLTRRRKAEHDLFIRPEPKSITIIAHEVIAGRWGNGSERKRRLEEAGYNYREVQKEVNYILCKS